MNPQHLRIHGGVVVEEDVGEVSLGLIRSLIDRRLNAERVHDFGTLKDQ